MDWLWALVLVTVGNAALFAALVAALRLASVRLRSTDRERQE
jgi:hypothetical protein